MLKNTNILKAQGGDKQFPRNKDQDPEQNVSSPLQNSDVDQENLSLSSNPQDEELIFRENDTEVEVIPRFQVAPNVGIDNSAIQQKQLANPLRKDKEGLLAQTYQFIEKFVPIEKAGCVLNVTLIGAIFYVLICVLVYFRAERDITLDSMSGALANIFSNLEAEPIVELTLVSQGASCPLGLKKISIGRWAGTKSGCDCPTSLSIDECDDNHTECVDVDGVQGFDLFSWKNSDWCARRASAGTQFIKKSICPNGFQECASGICIRDSLSCPITSVKFSTNSTGSSGKLADFADERYLVVERTVGERPLIGLQVSLNDIPCFNSNEFPIGHAGSYVLYNEKIKGCKKYGLDSEFSSAIDSQSQEKVLIQNKASSEVFDLPNSDAFFQETQALLAARYRIDVTSTDECLGVETKTLAKAGEAAEKISSVVSVVLTFGVTFQFILMLVIGFNFFRLYSKKTELEDPSQLTNSIVYFVSSLLLGGAQFIAYFVMFALVKSRHSLLQRTQEYFVLLKENDCFLVGQPTSVVVDFHSLIQEVTSRLYDDTFVLLLLSICLVALNAFVVNKNKGRLS